MKKKFILCCLIVTIVLSGTSIQASEAKHYIDISLSTDKPVNLYSTKTCCENMSLRIKEEKLFTRFNNYTIPPQRIDVFRITTYCANCNAVHKTKIVERKRNI